MPKRRCSRLTLGRKYARQKKSRVEQVPLMDWNTPLDIGEIDTADEDVTDERVADGDDEDVTDERVADGDYSAQGQNEEDIIELFKEALMCIKEAGKFLFIWQFLNLIVNGQFPFSCIIFTLFSEFIQWLSLSSTTGMCYSEESKQFWWTGKMLFGSKFIRFMEGFKHKGFIVSGDTDKGFYDPLKTSVNFAVPSEQVLSSFCPFDSLEQYKNGVPPGVIEPIVEVYAKHGEANSHIPTFDGKKLVPNSAEINLLGCEDKTTLKMKHTLEEDEKCLQDISSLIENLHESSTQLLQDISDTDKGPLAQELLLLFMHIGRRLEIVREFKNKKSYALSKLESKVDKLLTKDHFLMNHLKTYVYQCSVTIKDVANNLNDICEAIAVLNAASHNFVKENKVDISLQTNFAELLAPQHISEIFGQSPSDIPSEYLKQRSPEWFEVRKSVKVTGSTSHRAVGLDWLKEQRLFFDETMSGEQSSKSDAQQVAMDYGSKNEINAIATLVSKVMPVLYPRLTLNEEGTYKISDETSQPILCVSPDGSLHDTNETNKPFKTPAKVGIETRGPMVL